jgi:hypothetical protein
VPRGIHGSFPKFTFNSRLALKQVNAAAIVILKSAIRAWIEVGESGANEIPVWSGMARATLIPVGNLIDYNVPIFPVASAMPPKGPGSRIGEGAGTASARLIKLPGRYGFEWSHDVQHFKDNDTRAEMQSLMLGRLKNKTPWDFKKTADAVFEDEMREGLSSFPWASIIESSLKFSNVPVR